MDSKATLNIAANLKAMNEEARELLKFPGADVKRIIDNTGSLIVSVKVGKEVEFRAIGLCNDAKAAAAVKEQVDAGLAALSQLLSRPGQVPEEVLALPGKIKTTTKDNQAEASLVLPTEMAVTVISGITGKPGGKKP